MNRMKAWHKENPEKMREHRRKYIKNHRKEIKKYNHIYAMEIWKKTLQMKRFLKAYPELWEEFQKKENITFKLIKLNTSNQNEI